MSTSLFLYCRPGFEGECAAEIQQRAQYQGSDGYCRAKPDSGYVVFVPHDVTQLRRLTLSVRLTDLVFARQWFELIELCKDLAVDDRVAGLMQAIATAQVTIAELLIDTPDTNEAKELQPLCRALQRPLSTALERAGMLDAAGWRLHVCFIATHVAYVGISPLAASSPWAMGIRRLKFPAGAPSRSTLKLEEALLTLLSDDERQRLLRSNQTAVDLGAAPGGWTWQLVRRGLHVTAVDNGALAPALLASGQVEHLRADGFHYRPASPVDWMVCDMVEQPARIAELVVRWITQRWCRHTVFNLKLPMKKRYAEVQQCRQQIEDGLRDTDYRLRCKQLYHDREEVTCYLGLRE
ncbi:MAG: 23S rRNA (cytidine(2498)-2'-O)-methyltransferase RlmM [Gammaproteobacteria bacterium]|nr:23S rRNA (cytidine(2498)-2'-O)-methyltransferase RlmM [Gammaproteobacteria bacterium]